MSDNDLTVMGGNSLALLPGGKSVEIINKLLQTIAPVMRVAARCQVELGELGKKKESIVATNPMLSRKHDEIYDEICYEGGREHRRASERNRDAMYEFLALVHLEEAKLTRATLLPRFAEVQQAYGLLESVCMGEQIIDTKLAMRMLSVMLHVTQKKKADPITLAVYSSLFDPDIDSLGVSLNLWKEVPRHPIVIALAIQYLFRKQIFAPTPAELCSACRSVGSTLKARHRYTMIWLDSLSKADAKLYQGNRDEWARIYTTPESLASAPVLGWCCDGWVSAEDMWARDAAIREMMK